MKEDNKEIYKAILRMCIRMAEMLEDEEEAEKVKIFFSRWEDQEDGKELKAGKFIRYEGELYRVDEDCKVDKKSDDGKPNKEGNTKFRKIKKDKDNNGNNGNGNGNGNGNNGNGNGNGNNGNGNGKNSKISEEPIEGEE